jgi:TatD DNase family protein
MNDKKIVFSTSPVANEQQYTFFDTHCHININPLLPQADAIVSACAQKNIFMCVVGVNAETSAIAIEQTKKYPNVICAIGIHPCDIESNSTTQLQDFETLLSQNLNTINAIGEVGLDYYHKDVAPELQKQVFESCLELAMKYDKPIILHIRDAYQDAYDILVKYQTRLIRILIHCFDGDAD